MTSKKLYFISALLYTLAVVTSWLAAGGVAAIAAVVNREAAMHFFLGLLPLLNIVNLILTAAALIAFVWGVVVRNK